MWCRAHRCGEERKAEGRRKEKEGEGEGKEGIGAEEDNTDHNLVFLLETKLERILERLDDHTHTLRREREPMSHSHPDTAQETIEPSINPPSVRSCMECIDGRTTLRIYEDGPPSFCERHGATVIR